MFRIVISVTVEEYFLYCRYGEAIKLFRFLK
jgi:hypothetical protein